MNSIQPLIINEPIKFKATRGDELCTHELPQDKIARANFSQQAI